MTHFSPSKRKAVIAIASLVLLSLAAGAVLLADRGVGARAAGWLAVPVAAGAVLGLVLFGRRVVTARVIGPLEEVGAAALRLENGDLSTDIPRTDAPGMAGDLARSLAAIRAALLKAQVADTPLAVAGEGAPARGAQTSTVASGIVQDMTAALEKLAKGDLTVRLGAGPLGTAPPEDEALRSEFNAAARALQDRFQDMGKAIGAMRSGASDIHDAAGTLSDHAESQAASLGHSSSVLTHLTETVEEASKRLDQAETVTRESRTQAESGAAVVREAMDAMRRIEESSDNVRHIVGVLDGIAFQTNLLALNAGVEAARAGEAGKGFAVVASEVRSLAQRASESAKEIKGLITESSTQVSHGSKLVTTSGERLEAILENTIRFENVITDIAGVARDQADSIREINDHVGQLDVATRAAAGIADQVTAASSILTRSSVELAEGLSGLSLGPDNRNAPARAPANAPAPANRQGQPATPAPPRPKKTQIPRPVASPPMRLPDPPAASDGAVAAALPSLADFDGF